MDSLELSRRDFLKLSGLAVAGALFLRPKEALAKPPEHITFSQVCDFALRMNRMSHWLPDLSMPVNETTIVEWTQEIIPHYQSEGFIDKAVYPSSISFDDFFDDPLNIEGSTNLCTQAVKISSRMTNPMSVWYNSPDARTVIAHEDGHVQQKAVATFVDFASGKPECESKLFFGAEDEVSAQVGAMEVLAGMALEGNKYAVYSLVGFLKELSMHSAQFLAVDDKKLLSQYQYLEQTVYQKASEQARLEAVRNMVSVRKYEEGYRAFLKVYNYSPLDKVLTAIRGDGIAHDLIYPHTDVPMDDMRDFLSGNMAERLVGQLIAK